ncbi:MAG: chloride channel protein [Magnetococcales bacterium]|nr:chloride channel protein [Magnetococcales bacterium]
MSEVTKIEHSKLKLTHIALLILAASVIGGFVAIAIALFLQTVHLVQDIFHVTPLHQLPEGGGARHWSLPLILGGGGLVVGLLCYYIMPGRANKGMMHVLEADLLNDNKVSMREGFGVGLLSAISIGFGASVGRYGPSVHMGAALGSLLASFSPLKDSRRTLFASGIAAAISASFNAPLAGILFAHEVILRKFSIKTFIPIAVSSVAGSATAQLLDVHIKGVPVAMTGLSHYWYEYLFFAILGLLSGVVTVIFMRSLMWSVPRLQGLPIDSRIRPALGGVVLGVIGMQFPHVLGLGAEVATHAAIFQQLPLTLLLTLLALKMVTTPLSLGAGFSGGVFGPALFIGAMLGAAFAGVIDQYANLPISPLSLYALVGMGGVISPILGAPISTILTIFEITTDYEATTAILMGVACAHVVTHRFFGHSLFERQLAGRGIDLLKR